VTVEGTADFRTALALVVGVGVDCTDEFLVPLAVPTAAGADATGATFRFTVVAFSVFLCIELKLAVEPILVLKLGPNGPRGRI